MPDCKQKSNERNIQSFGLALGSFSMNQIFLAVHKHMSNLVLYAFQMYFESNIIFMDSLFITPELLQKILQEFTLSSYIWPLWAEREQVFMSILQLLKEQNLLLSPGIQHKNFNYLICLHPPWWLVLTGTGRSASNDVQMWWSSDLSTCLHTLLHYLLTNLWLTCLLGRGAPHPIPSPS